MTVVFTFLSIFLGFVVLWLIIACLRNLNFRKCTKKPPMFPGALPIIGHSLTMLKYGKDFWIFFRDAMLFAINNGKDACTVVFGQYNLHILTDPDECYTIANTCVEKHDIYKFGKVFMGEGLITGTGSIWKQHRKLLSPAFNQQVLDGFLGTFNKESKKLVNSLNEKTGKLPFDPLPYIQNWALYTICSTTMGFHGSENDTQVFNEYTSVFHSLSDYQMQRVRKIWLHNDLIFKWSSLGRQVVKISNVLWRLSNKIIAKKEIEIQNKLKDISNYEKSKFKAYIELLMTLKMNNVFTTKEVQDEANTLIGAGYDTTLLTINQILIKLGSNPVVQEKVYKELLEIFGGIDRDVSKEDLSRMKYLEAVIKESMRLHPIVPIIMRKIDKEICLRNYSLASGDDVMISIYAINRHSVWGPDAEVFRPERWLDPDTLPDKPYAFASFSIGRRNCIGLNYAMMTMKTALAHILLQYKITSDENRVKYQLQVTLTPVSGNHIIMEKRQDV